ncbi:aromatic-ring hydroxylase C-terminal domain-containing protein [Streptomyces sp. NBC_01358]|uniref:aromatic-ring hydroxylase C-terminal domain-containing protein n=1 Tax=Streptomyces sp. NBC_01358 TaxID=2903837 RepID=UPI002E339A07|nr:hypothetical protein [Streptomyces sp. NBC_01358]
MDGRAGVRGGVVVRCGGGQAVPGWRQVPKGCALRPRTGRATSRTCRARRATPLGFSALLIRPDGVVAWAGEQTPDRAAFERTAGRWFGGPESQNHADDRTPASQRFDKDG